jgi:hypothetical protein
MTVSWQVPAAVKDPFLRVGAHPWDLSRRIKAEVRTLYTPAPRGHYATLKVRGIAETVEQVDHFTVARRAR